MHIKRESKHSRGDNHCNSLLKSKYFLKNVFPGLITLFYCGSCIGQYKMFTLSLDTAPSLEKWKVKSNQIIKLICSLLYFAGSNLCLGLKYQNPFPLSPRDFGKDSNFSPTPRKSTWEFLQCGKDWLPRQLEGFLFFTVSFFFSFPVAYWSCSNYYKWIF